MEQPSGSERPGWKSSGREFLAPSALGSAFVMGLTSLGYQVLWTRLLSSGTGNTTYVFTLILTIFLIGLAYGANLIVRVVSRGLPIPLRLLGLTQLAVALLALAGVAAFRAGRIVFHYRSFRPPCSSCSRRLLSWDLHCPWHPASSAKVMNESAGDVGLLPAREYAWGRHRNVLLCPSCSCRYSASQRSIVALSLANAGLGIFLLRATRSINIVPKMAPSYVRCKRSPAVLPTF